KQALLDQHRHLTREWDRLLPFIENANIPIVFILRCSELGGLRLGVGAELTYFHTLTLNFSCPRPLALLEAFDTCHDHRPVAVRGIENGREKESQSMVAVFFRPGLGELLDCLGSFFDWYAAAGEDRNEFHDMLVFPPFPQVLDWRTVPHLHGRELVDLVLNAWPVGANGLDCFGGATKHQGQS